jgi:type II secretory pathway pseudopilin PulG
MGIKTETGFTIIETMLFLAVTGLLAGAILVGSGVAISQQRYRDSVNSLKSYVQQQYSEVTNVTNGRDKSWTCDGVGNVAQSNPAAGQARGTSDCVVLGRYITVDATGTQLAASNVVGFRKVNAVDATSDIAEIMTNYQLGISPIDKDTSEVSWGAQIVKQKTTTPMPLSVLIIRSPLSGSIMTFVADGVQASISGLVSVGNMSQRKDLCVNAEPGSFVGRRLEVQIDAFATNQGAIEVPPESSSICD